MKKYNLTEESTKEIIERHIRPTYQNITYQIRKSKTSNSIYVAFQLDNIRRVVRLSDHKTPANIYSKQVYLKDEKEICNIFKKTIKQLQKEHLDELLELFAQK